MPFERFRHERAHWLDDYALFRALRPATAAPTISSGRRSSSTRSRGARRRPSRARDGHRARSLRTVPAVSPGGRASTARARERRAPDRRPAVLRLARFERRLGPPGALPARRAAPAALRRGRAAGLLQRGGQLWGNPVYDWEALRRTGYRWCIDRLRALLAHVDVIRLDHFRGFAAAWHVPAGAPTAQTGQWVPGPGAELFAASARRARRAAVHRRRPRADHARRIRAARPLPDARHAGAAVRVRRKRRQSLSAAQLPPRTPSSTRARTTIRPRAAGTTSCRTGSGGTSGAMPSARRRRRGRGPGDDGDRLVLRAALAIAPLQDVLNLGNEARMNVPGQAHGNWGWRATEDALSAAPFERLKSLTSATNRSPTRRSTDEPR